MDCKINMTASKDKSFWAFLLVLSLVLCLWGYFHPYARLGFSLLPVLLCANYKVLVDEWHKGIPRWIMIPWLVMLAFAIGHLVYGKALTDAMGLLLTLLMLGVYLLARTMPDELRKWFAIFAIVGSITLITDRLSSATTIDPGIFGIFHIAAFAILVGILLAPKELRLWTMLLGIPAIAISGSEEGLIAIVIIGVYFILTRRISKQVTVLIGLIILLLIPLLATGWLQSVYPRLNTERFQPSLETLSNERWSSYTDLAVRPSIWIPGAGWYWNTIGSAEAKDIDPSSLWKTVHNSPVRVASQFGIAAALSWLFIFLFALWKFKHNRAIFLAILCFAMLDPFMVGAAIAWAWGLLGVCYAIDCKVEDSVSLAGIPVASTDSSVRCNTGAIGLRDAEVRPA